MHIICTSTYENRYGISIKARFSDDRGYITLRENTLAIDIRSHHLILVPEAHYAPYSDRTCTGPCLSTARAL